MHSRVAIDIVTEAANIVRLTLTHTQLEFDSEMYRGSRTAGRACSRA